VYPSWQDSSYIYYYSKFESKYIQFQQFHMHADVMFHMPYLVQ